MQSLLLLVGSNLIFWMEPENRPSGCCSLSATYNYLHSSVALIQQVLFRLLFFWLLPGGDGQPQGPSQGGR